VIDSAIFYGVSPHLAKAGAALMSGDNIGNQTGCDEIDIG
jgi:hypothetical protein